ncbi:MAG: HEAT repeat domain-containing protein, partial [Planctomycetota bacterium]
MQLCHRHDNEKGAMVVNAFMNTARSVGAISVALFSLALAAQQPTPQSTIEAHLAAATMAEARGDLAAAERELRAAQQIAAPMAQREAVGKALSALLQRTGQDTPAEDEGSGVQVSTQIAVSSPEPAQDPVRRLIDRLAQGGLGDPEVKRASDDLRQLGALATGPLVEALPRAEGFLLLHAMTLLRGSDDPRIAKALVQRIDGKDPAIAQAIASRLDELTPAVRRPVAERLAAADQPPSVRAMALVAMLRSEGMPAGTEDALRSLAKIPAAQEALLDAARDRSEPWVEELAAALLESEDGWKRGEGILLSRRFAEASSEVEVLEVLRSLPESMQGMFADRFVLKHPEWVHVAAMGLAANNANAQSRYLQVQWWQMPDFSAKALLAHMNRGSKHAGQFEAPLSSQQVEQILRSCIDAGWRASEDVESELAEYCLRQNRWSLLVEALSDEERAIVWRERLGAPGRAIAFEAASSGKPWHRLVVEELAASSDPDADAPQLINNRSWVGLDEATKQKLIDVVARWTKELPVPRTAWTTGAGMVNGNRFPASYNWVASLLGEAPHARLVPVEVVLLLARAGHEPAFEALRTYDQALFFRECDARLGEDNSYAIADYVVRYGTAQQRPLLLRCLAFSNTDRWRGNDMEAKATMRLRAWASGSLDVLALGAADANGAAVATATVEASKVSVDHLARLLSLMPTLHDKVSNEAKRALRPQLRTVHGETLHAALAALLASDSARPSELAVDETKVFLVESLVAIGRTESKDLLERVVDAPRGNADSRAAAASALLAFAGDQRGAVLRRLLLADAPGVVAVAFAAEEQRTDPGLRDATFATVVRLGATLGDEANAWFAAMNATDATAIASALLEHESFPRMTRTVVESALRALSASKDGSHVAVLARVASHPVVGVRVAVATNLGRTFDRSAVPHLIQMLKDDHNDVILSANAALKKLSEFFDAEKKW